MHDPPKTSITHALLILEEPLAKILAGTKTWEIRGSATKRRGRIALIQSKSGLVVGTCDLVDVVGPLSLKKLRSASWRTGEASATAERGLAGSPNGGGCPPAPTTATSRRADDLEGH